MKDTNQSIIRQKLKNQHLKTNAKTSKLCKLSKQGERRELNPRMMESQPIGVTVCLHPPLICIDYIIHIFI